MAILYTQKLLKIAGGRTLKSEFDEKLCARWKEAMAAGLFRYDLSETRTKVLDGPHRYIALLNEKRATERRAADPMHSVNQPFDVSKFNFNKAKEAETLFTIQRADRPASLDKMIINVSPIDFAHSLIVPEIDKNLNQNLTTCSIELALEIMCLSSSSSFKIGFNSLCAHASVNHLHLHCYYTDYTLLADTLGAVALNSLMYQLNSDAPRGYGFELHSVEDIPRLSRRLFACTNHMKDRNIAYGLFICRGSSFTNPNIPVVRILLWPRVKVLGAKPTEAAFNTAILEIAGHLLIKDKSYYETITDETAHQCLRECSLSDNEFNELTQQLLELSSL